MSTPPSPIKSRSSSPFIVGARQLPRRILVDNPDAGLEELEAAGSAAERNVVLPPAPMYKIVLTGGPCGGKTTSMARLAPYLRERGFEVMTCPEAFSLLVGNGMPFDYLQAVEGMDTVVQDTVLDTQIAMEDGFERVLRARGRPAVLLCDRGLMDGSAYMDPAAWDRLVARRGVRCASALREGRYNAVFHLVTAAEGAERFYTLENNAARTEAPELARELDNMTRNAWVGHPHLKIFDNSTDFERKLQRIVEETARLIGLPTQIQRDTTKFVLQREPDLESFPEDVRVRVFDVEKVYINMLETSNEQFSEEYSFIRKRTSVNREGQAVGSVYGWTCVQKTHEGQIIEKKRIITQREYTSLFRNRDVARHIVRQQRISFLWNVQSFTVHVYREPVADLCLLHAQVRETNAGCDAGVALPPFLEAECVPLTGSDWEDRKYSAYHISLKH